MLVMMSVMLILVMELVSTNINFSHDVGNINSSHDVGF